MDFQVEWLSPKLARRRGWTGFPPYDTWAHCHWCAACNTDHDFYVEAPTSKGARWTFDGNADSPTFTPSMNIRIGPMRDGSIKVCHYIVTAGQVQFCGDCTHALVGQTVPLPDFPPEIVERWRAYVR